MIARSVATQVSCSCSSLAPVDQVHKKGFINTGTHSDNVKGHSVCITETLDIAGVHLSFYSIKKLRVLLTLLANLFE